MGGPLSLFRMHWDHEPDNAVGARLCEPQRVATAPGPCGSQTRAPGPQVHGVPPFASRMHWDHEPVRGFLISVESA